MDANLADARILGKKGDADSFYLAALLTVRSPFASPQNDSGPFATDNTTRPPKAFQPICSGR